MYFEMRRLKIYASANGQWGHCRAGSSVVAFDRTGHALSLCTMVDELIQHVSRLEAA